MLAAPAPHLPIIFDLLGILTSSAAGALTGIRKGLDLVGVLVLAAVTGLGGGVVRDLMIGAVPVAMLTDWRYLATASFAAALVLLAQHPRILGRRVPMVDRVRRRIPLSTAFLVADSATLGCFAVSGTAKALDYGLALIPASLMGVVTAVGGGVLRDVLVNEVPTVLRRELYAVPALVGALIVGATNHYDPAATPLAFAAAVTMTLRLLAVRNDWHARLPGALGWWWGVWGGCRLRVCRVSGSMLTKGIFHFAATDITERTARRRREVRNHLGRACGGSPTAG